jgi:hypothetical protein
VDVEQMFNSFTVIFHERWDPLGTRSAQELYAWRAEAAKRAALTFLHDVCLEQAAAVEERFFDVVCSSRALEALLEEEVTVAWSCLGSRNSLVFTVEPTGKLHSILWAVGDHMTWEAFFRAFQRCLGREHLVYSAFADASFWFACYVLYWLTVLGMVVEMVLAGPPQNTRESVMEWSSRLVIAGGLLVDLVFLTVYHSFPLKHVHDPFHRTVCMVAAHSKNGLRAMKCLPAVIAVCGLGWCFQVHALDGYLTPMGLVLLVSYALQLVVGYVAYHSIRPAQVALGKVDMKHHDWAAPMHVALVILSGQICFWCLAVLGEVPVLALVVTSITTGVIAHSMYSFVRFTKENMVIQKAIHEWRLLQCATLNSIVLGLVNRPDSLLRLEECDYDAAESVPFYECGVTRAWFLCMVSLLKGAQFARTSGLDW